MAARSVTDRKRRSPHAQLTRMRGLWPDFVPEVDKEIIIWTGTLRPFQAEWRIRVLWFWRTDERPYVQLLDPPLRPREGTEYADIPHLIYFAKDPALSALCLYDPDGGQWDPRMLIADTTIPWAADWLKFYEFWLYDGIWRGKSVGPESAAKIRA